MPRRSVADRIKSQKSRTVKLSAIGLSAIVMVASCIAAPLAQADRYDDQIRALNQQNTQSRGELSQLEAEEASLAGTLAALRAKIAALEAQIRENQAKREELLRKISAAEAEIAEQKRILGINIKKMYLEDDMTTTEMIASSKNLSEFVDREQYRVSVQGQIKTTLERIDQLKKELESQKVQVEKMLKDQQAMQSDLDAQRAEVNRLIGLNQSQQAEYEQGIRANSSRIAELKRQQAAENARHFSGGIRTGGSGGYPWANVPYPSTSVDPWGMYKRECVSYTAWRVATSGRHMPYWGGRGNAKQWDDNARAAGIPVDGTPRVGDVAVSNAGTYGHVMYVEAVHGDGTISISQYNAGWDGKYSEGRRSTSGLVFIHFP